MEFFSWGTLATAAGSLAATVVITQLTKEVKWISKLPTQLWSYIVAVIILFLAHFFTKELTLESGVLILVNAAVVALGANGGFEALNRMGVLKHSGEKE